LRRRMRLAGFATDAVHVSSSGRRWGCKAWRTHLRMCRTWRQWVRVLPRRATSRHWHGSAVEINTLANILASCVNSTGTVSGPTNPTACYTLLRTRSPAGVGATTDGYGDSGDHIAHNPGNAVAALYGLSTAAPPFASALTRSRTTSPSPFDHGNGLSEAGRVAIDGQGMCWTENSNGDSVSEFTNLGAAVATYPERATQASTSRSGSRSTGQETRGSLILFRQR